MVKNVCNQKEIGTNLSWFMLCTIKILIWSERASLIAQLVKNLPAMQETWVWSLGWGGSPGEGKDYPFQYSGLENFMDSIVHGVAKSQTRLSNLKKKVKIQCTIWILSSENGALSDYRVKRLHCCMWEPQVQLDSVVSWLYIILEKSLNLLVPEYSSFENIRSWASLS